MAPETLTIDNSDKVIMIKADKEIVLPCICINNLISYLNNLTGVVPCKKMTIKLQQGVYKYLLESKDGRKWKETVKIAAADDDNLFTLDVGDSWKQKEVVVFHSVRVTIMELIRLYEVTQISIDWD